MIGVKGKSIYRDCYWDWGPTSKKYLHILCSWVCWLLLLGRWLSGSPLYRELESERSAGKPSPPGGEWRKAWKCPISGHLARSDWAVGGSMKNNQRTLKANCWVTALLGAGGGIYLSWGCRFHTLSIRPLLSSLSACPLCLWDPAFCFVSSFFEVTGHLLSEHVCVSVKDPNAPRMDGRDHCQVFSRESF